MHIVDLLGPDTAAEFSTSLTSLPQALHYGPKAAEALARGLRDHCEGRGVTVLFDVRTREAAGGQCVQALRDAGWSVEECIVPDREGGAPPKCDDLTKDRIQQALDETDALVAVGSGVVNDLTKWVAAERSRPYAVFATAASMNGYAAANVAPTIRGVKSLFRARAPRLIAADPAVLEAAPHTLTASGLGDLVAKPVSTADWRVDHVLFDEPYSPTIAAVIDRVEKWYLDEPSAIARHEPRAIRALFEALVLSGCAMTLQGSSLPASGGEHLISHALDMLSDVDGIPHDLHGRQVGIATVFVAALYEKMLELEAPTFAPPASSFEPAAWGSIATSVRVEHDKKGTAIASACRRLSEHGTWERLRETIAGGLRPAQRVKQCLADAGAAHRLEDMSCSRERFLRAVRLCSSIRGRFTSIDLAACCGILPGVEEEIVDRFLL